MKSRKPHTSSIIALITFILFQTYLFHCPQGKAAIINTDYQKECVACPNNCDICYMNQNQELLCVFCLPGFFLDQQRNCLPCVEGCQNCNGPKIENCRILKQGFFYNQEQKQLTQCSDDSCGKCFEKYSCSACKQGFYIDSKKETQKGFIEVTCLPCQIPNCMYCNKREDQLKKSAYIACNFCKQGFALVSGKCEQCSENCLYCSEETLECQFCEQGFYFNKQLKICLKAPVQYCQQVDKEGNCIACENMFVLLNNKCEACQKFIPNCKQCSLDKQQPKCTNCMQGYSSNQEGQCQRCPENCSYCDRRGCLQCKFRFFYDKKSQACQPCYIENCKICSSPNQCTQCSKGFFFDSNLGQCTKCKNNCLECLENGEDCLSCPINLFQMEVQQISMVSPINFLQTFLSQFIPNLKLESNESIFKDVRTVAKCLEQCPQTFQGKQVTVNYALRTCRMADSKQQTQLLQPQSQDAQQVILPESPTNDLLTNILAFKQLYDQEIENIKKSANERSTNGLSKECYYNGNLKRKMIGNTNSYYICRCIVGFRGDNCQISNSLYENAQNQVAGFIDQMHKKLISETHYISQRMFKMMTIIIKFKLSVPVMDSLITLVSLLIDKDKQLENKRKLYGFFDGLLLNLFDSLEEIKRLPNEAIQTDQDIQKQISLIYDLMSKVQKKLETSIEEFKLNKQLENYEQTSLSLFDTFSYKFNEFPLSKYDPRIGFLIFNPNIDTSYNNMEPNKIFLLFEQALINKSLKFNVELLNYASPLFDRHLQQLNQISLSNLLKIKIIDPSDLHYRVNNNDTQLKQVVIQFQMNFIPGFERLEEVINCKVLKLQTMRQENGILEAVNENDKFVRCKYQIGFELDDHYFFASIKK